MMKAMWIGAVTVVGGLVGLRHGWRRQAVDAAGCAVALALAYWQYPRIVPYVRALWPVWKIAAGGTAVREIALGYLFVVLYGLSHVLVSVYVPDDAGSASDRRWLSGVIGAAQAGALAVLTLSISSYA